MREVKDEVRGGSVGDWCLEENLVYEGKGNIWRITEEVDLV